MNAPWDTLLPRVVMVARDSERDGIGRYAEQLITNIQPHEVLRVGIAEGPGDYHRNFHRRLRALWLLRDARRRDDVVVHWHPRYYVRGRVAAHVSWGVLALIRRLTFVLHEPDPPGGRLQEAARRWAWRRAKRLVFHSDWERDRQVRRFGTSRRQETPVTEHGSFFRTSVTFDREEARRALGLPPSRPSCS